MAYYQSGTITLTNASAAFSHSGGLSANVKPGDTIVRAGVAAIVATVDTNTTGTLASAWSGPSYTGTDFQINHTGSGWATVAALHETVVELLEGLRTNATLTGKLTTKASATGAAGFNIPAGAAPTAPVTGDLWATATDLFYRFSGSTLKVLTALLQSGTGAAAVTFADLHKDIIFRPAMFAAAGDPDDTLAVQRSITAAVAAAVAGKAVRWELDRDVNISSALTANLTAMTAGRIEFVALGGAKFKLSGTNYTALTITGGGATVTATQVNGTAARKAKSIVVLSGTGFAAGDLVFISNGLTGARAQLNRLTGVAGTTLTLERPLAFPVSASASVTVTKYTAQRGLKVTNLEFDGTATTATSNANAVNGLYLQGWFDPLVSGIKARALTWGAAFFTNTIYLGTLGEISAEDCANGTQTSVSFAVMGSTRVQNVKVRGSLGFGITVSQCADCDFVNLGSEGNVGRGIVLIGAAGNRWTNPVCNGGKGVGTTGFSLTQGSAFNLVGSLEAGGNTSSGVWTDGILNTDNIFLGVNAFGNTSSDIAVSATPNPDTGNAYIGVNADAVVLAAAGTNPFVLKGSTFSGLSQLVADNSGATALGLGGSGSR